MACQVATAAAFEYNGVPSYEHAASSSADLWSSIHAVSCRQNQEVNDDHEEDRSTTADSEPEDLPQEASKGRWADLADSDEEEPQAPLTKSAENDGKTRRWADVVDSDDENETHRHGSEKVDISDKAERAQQSLPFSSASCTEVPVYAQVDPATPGDIRSNTTNHCVDGSERSQWAEAVAWQTQQTNRRCRVGEHPHHHSETLSNDPAARAYVKGAARNTNRGCTDSARKATGKATGKGASISEARARNFDPQGTTKSGGWNGNACRKGHGKGANAKGQGKNASEKLQCQFTIGIEEDTKFRVVKRIIGQGGENMKNIAQNTDAKLRLRGRGSKFLEGFEQKESTDELMLCVSCQDRSRFDRAKTLVSELLEQIYEHYRLFCAKAGQSQPSLSIRLHEGYREGSR